MHVPRRLLPFLAIALLLSACAPLGSSNSDPVASSAPTQKATTTISPSPTSTAIAVCPASLGTNCRTPYDMRVAYSVQSLLERGFTGKGQTIVDIVSYGSPTLQQDMDVLDQQFGLPPITINVLSPLGTKPVDHPTVKDLAGWAGETTLDVQIIHAIAPDAAIVVLTSPVNETEGTIGLPQFLQLEQYAVSHHLGQIFSQSYVASEVTLADSKGQQLVKTYTDFYRQITTQQGFTVVSGSGDHGATDWANLDASQLSPTAIVNFPADVPWVTAVGGTTLLRNHTSYDETAWSGSGGGVSKFFSEPAFQQSLPASVQSLLGGHRGLPDIAAVADPDTAMINYIHGRWTQIGGTSASTPLWAGIIAIANQMAGHPLGYINPAIYKVATSQNFQKDFRDITTGSNRFTSGKSSVDGFQAAPGWDAVTGWGVPQADQFIPD